MENNKFYIFIRDVFGKIEKILVEKMTLEEFFSIDK